MNFNEYLGQSWKTHAADSAAVAQSFANGLGLIQTEEQIAQMAQLVAHVSGEHLGQWQEGVAILNGLKSHPKLNPDSESDKALVRSIAALEFASGSRTDLNAFSASDQIRILTMTAGALAERNLTQAKTNFLRALELSETLTQEDPAHRALAVTGNNLACTLEEKEERSSEETALMLLAAHTGRKHWALAGTWKEIERAEYRLSQSYLQAEDFELSFKHAQNCLSICQDHSAPPFEFFYAYEALALAENARNKSVGFERALAAAEKSYAALLSEEKAWAKATLERLKSL